MIGGTATNSHPVMAASPSAVLAVARCVQLPPADCALGPMLTASPSRVASGQPYRGRHDRFRPVYGQGVCSARWAALGCDATSRQPHNAKSAGIAKSPRLQVRQFRKSSYYVQALAQQLAGLDPMFLGNAAKASTAFGLRKPFVLNRRTGQRQQERKVRIGAFHVVGSYPSTPSVEAFT